MRTFFSRALLLLVLLFGPIVIFLIVRQEMSVTMWLLPGAVLVWLLLFATWFLTFGKGRFLDRLGRVGIVTAIFLGIAILLSILLRYEGSASGSSFPRFSWIWQERESSQEVTPGLIEKNIASVSEELQAAAGESKDFLGPGRDGTWEKLPFDPDWNTNTPRQLWRRSVGKAWSSFAVAQDRAITQEQVGDAERVTCLDLFTGEEAWHHDNPGTRLLLVKEENSGGAMGGDGPRSTPVIHGGRVYSIGATGIVNCLDLESGELIWTRNVIADFGGETQRWGIANAPLVLPEAGIVVVAGTDQMNTPGIGAGLVALDLESGAERWVYTENGASYSSPRILTLLGTKQIVSVNFEEVVGMVPETGEVLWRHEWRGKFPKVAQPIQVGEDRVLVTASYGAGSPLIRLSRDGETWKTEELWKSNRMKTKFSSAVVMGDQAYGLDEGRLASIDLATGDKVWKNQKFGFGQQLLFGDHLLVQTERGPVVTGRLDPEGFTETGRIEDALDSMTWNVPAVAGRFLLVRNDREAACYLLPEPKS